MPLPPANTDASFIGEHAAPVDRQIEGDVPAEALSDALAAAERRSTLLFERNPFPMWIFDVNTLAFLDVNEAAISHYGYSREEFLSMTLNDIRPAEDLDVFRQDIAKQTTAYHDDGPWRHIRKGGSMIEVQITVLPIDYQGRQAKFVTAIDVTAREQAQRQLHSYVENLARANSDLKQFAYAASHDLQEPIRNVVLFTQLLVKSSSGAKDDLQEYSKHILDGAKRIQDRVAGLRRYWELSQANPQMDSVIDASAVLAEVLNRLDTRFSEIGAAVHRAALPALAGDGQELATVLEELLDNAVNFRSGRPLEIRIAAELLGKYCRLSVEDNGIGIAPAYCTRVFELFKRLSTSTPGIGMGLAIAKNVVERHGGRIWAESAEGTGSTFCFTWPLAGKSRS